MRLGIIGCGRAAASLARALAEAGHVITAITCRREESARLASEFLGGATIAVDNHAVALASEVILVGVSDDAIGTIAAELRDRGTDLSGRIVLHLSGALDSSILEPLTASGVATGSLHPLQTFPERVASPRYLAGVTFGIDGDPAAVATAEALCRDLRGRPHRLAPGVKVYYHAAAAIAANTSTASLDLALKLLARAGLTRREDALRALFPLLFATLAALEQHSGETALTGPIARGDTATVSRHLEALAGDELSSYIDLQSTVARLAARKPNTTEATQAIARVFANPPLTVVAALRSESVEGLLDAARSARQEDADRVEHRIDLLANPESAAVETLVAPDAILTCRSGPRLRPANARALLERALRAGAMVDVAIEDAWDELPRERLVLSYHGSLAGATAAAHAIASRHPAVGKLAIAIDTPTELCALPALSRILRSGCREVAVMATGTHGLPSRVLARKFGSDWVYASLTGELATAPGQVPLNELLGAFRVRHVSRSSRVFGLVGEPIEHSLSPRIMNRILPQLLGDAIYIPIAIRGVDDLVRLARELPLDGVSVTMPLKRAIIDRLDEVTETAGACGAVNTIVRSGPRLIGANTDAEAIVTVARTLLDLHGVRALILGAGGAARAAAAGLHRAGAEVHLWARSSAAAAEINRSLGFGEVVDRPEACDWQLLVNATPVGMGESERSPLPMASLTGEAVIDLIYNPRKTRLLTDAAVAGLRIAPGLEVFLAQAAAQIRWFTGHEVTVDRLRRIVA